MMSMMGPHDDERLYCVLEEPVYCVPIDISPAVTIPSVFLKAARESLLPAGRRIRDNRALLPPHLSGDNDRQSLLTPDSRLRKYSFHLKNIGYREKVLAVILAIFIITFVSLVTSVIVMVCNQNTDIQQPSTQTSDVQDYRTYVLHHSMKKISSYHPIHDKNRSPCVGTCWTYSAFRFRSQCISGYCQCGGEFYNDRTCLPDVYGCKIDRNVTEAEAFFNDIPQVVYTCSSTNEKQATNHVISTYGHHNSDTVNIDVRSVSTDNQPITLILANYYPTKWRLNVSREIQISKIILMSNDHVSYSSVQLHDGSNEADVPPRIRKVSVRVGYGDDRNGEHTVDLLKYVIRHLGPIASFSGAHYADQWTVTLGRHEAGVTYKDMV